MDVLGEVLGHVVSKVFSGRDVCNAKRKTGFDGCDRESNGNAYQ